MEQLYTLIGTVDGEVVSTIAGITLQFCEELGRGLVEITADAARDEAVEVVVECRPD